MKKLEARAGIEPAIELLQSPALPLGYPAQGEGDSIGERKKVKFLTPHPTYDETSTIRAAYKCLPG